MAGWAAHRCLPSAYEAPCPICFDPVDAESPMPVVLPPCGHPMHEPCLTQYDLSYFISFLLFLFPLFRYIQHDNFKCPLCAQLLGDMSRQFAELKSLIAAQPMPPAYALARATVRCVCCSAVTEGVPFHFLGHECGSCHSLNTTLMATSGLPDIMDTEE